MEGGRSAQHQFNVTMKSLEAFLWKYLTASRWTFTVFSVIIIGFLEGLEAVCEMRVKNVPESHQQLPFCSSVGVKVLGRSVRLEK